LGEGNDAWRKSEGTKGKDVGQVEGGSDKSEEEEVEGDRGLGKDELDRERRRKKERKGCWGWGLDLLREKIFHFS